MSPCMSHGGQFLHACHMVVNVSKQIFMTQTFKTCVCSEANFQLANFRNTNFQNMCVCAVKQTFNLQTFIT